ATAGMIPAWAVGMAFGSKDYSRIVSRVTMAYTLTLGIYTTIAGYLFDLTGSYNLAFIITAICTLISVLLYRIALGPKNNLMLQAKNQTTADA
ncbi:MAG TPA: MFS transporter, partial [Clostridiaceae bacterium]|nr:MFS transporter [Clostridiaceae bacterium]